MAISPSGSTPNLSAQQLNPAQQEGPPPQTPTDGARQGDIGGVTGTSRGGNFKGLAQIRKEFLAKAHQAISHTSKQLEQARKNPQGLSGLGAILEELKQRLGGARANQQAGMSPPALLGATATAGGQWAAIPAGQVAAMPAGQVGTVQEDAALAARLATLESMLNMR